MRPLCILSLFLLLIIGKSYGQRDHSYLPSKRYFKMQYVSYDDKDKIQYKETWQLVSKSKSRDGILSYNIESEITTRKQNTFYQNFHYSSSDSLFYIGSELYLDPIRLDSYHKMTIKIDADSVIIPLFPSVGQILPEASCQASILRGSGSVLISMNVLLFNRTVESMEDISTPAGNYSCFKISSDKMCYSGINKRKTKLIEWYSINTGLVRSEEYQKNGKLISYKVLESLVEDFFVP